MNVVLLKGKIVEVKKIKGLISQFKIEVWRDVDDLKHLDIPLLVPSPNLTISEMETIKKENLVHVSAHIETEVKGGYGTVTKIVADLVIPLSLYNEKEGRIKP